MATVPENLEKILQAKYGEEVRGAIYDSIRQCYIDGGDYMIPRPDLSDGTDLNTLTATGVYFVGTSITVTNAPARSGLLLVFADPNNTITRNYQIFKSYETEAVYFRHVKDGVFTDWSSFEYGEKNTTLFDFNNYLEQGFYAIGDDIDGYGNIPFDTNDEYLNGGLLFVYNDMQNDTIQRTTQLFIPTSNNPHKSKANVSYRSRINGKWTGWQSFGFGDINATIDDIDTVKRSGYYFISSGNVPSNAPNSLSNGGMLTLKGPSKGGEARFYYEVTPWKSGRKLVRFSNADGSLTKWYDETHTVSSRRVNASTYIIDFGSFKMNLFGTNDSGTNSNNWNIGNIRSHEDGILVPYGTDIIGPVKLLGDSDFVGGVHGDEKVDHVHFYIDGVNILASDEAYHIGPSATFVMKSKVYSEKTKTYSFDRYVTCYIEPNRIHVFNTYKAVRELTLERATLGGLIAARNDIIQNMIFDHDYNDGGASSNIGLGNKTKHATINTINGSVTVNNLGVIDPNTYNAFVAAFTNENPPRSKIYFDNLKANSSGYEINVGDLISGEFEYLFS